MRVMQTVLGLLASGAVRTDELPVRRFAFAEAPAAYRWLDEQGGAAIKVVLAYEGEDGSHRGEHT
jgi:threonine dehydrogenase-like Zn-dependent dehydrogenase